LAKIDGFFKLKFAVKPAPSFIRWSKVVLKKYPNMKSDLKSYLADLEGGIKGKNIPGFNELWKDRLAIKPYNIGERGGLRIISYHNPAEAIIIPALIYAKSDMENPPNKLLIETITEIRHWLDIAGS
jgi:hypothetical protein